MDFLLFLYIFTHFYEFEYFINYFLLDYIIYVAKMYFFDLGSKKLNQLVSNANNFILSFIIILKLINFFI